MPHSTMLDLPALSARLRIALDLSSAQRAMNKQFLQQDSLLAIWRTLVVRRDLADAAFELSPGGDVLVQDEDPWHRIFKTDVFVSSPPSWVLALRCASLLSPGLSASESLMSFGCRMKSGPTMMRSKGPIR
jgi:hypothetical protein